MNYDANTLTALTRTARPEALDGPAGLLDDEECELLLQQLLTGSRDEKERTKRPSQTPWRWLAAGGSLVGAAAVVLIVALIAVGGHNRGVSSAHHAEPFPSQIQTVADISANTSRAVLAASQTGILQSTSTIVGSGQATGPTTRSWSDLSNSQAVLEILGPDGSPQTVMVQGSSGTVAVISYKDRAWWTAPSFSGANGQTLSPTIESAQGQIQDLEAALAKGTMQIIARAQSVDDQTTIELAGSELPSALGEQLTIWINESTYLPVQARSVDSLPTSLAPSGGLETDTTYQWVPPTAANLAQLTPSIPAGFPQLSGPPLQSPPTTPGVG
jgi:hypothetical protein